MAEAPLSVSPIDDLVDEEDLPDWLKEAQDDEGAEQPLSAPVVGESSVPMLDADGSIVEEDDLPDWLQEVQVEGPDEDFFDADSGPLDDIVAEEDLPDWLSDVQADDSEPFEPSEPTPQEPGGIVEEDLPNWLQEVQEDETSEFAFGVDDTAAPSFEAEVEEEDSLVDEEQLPDWLQDIEEEEAEDRRLEIVSETSGEGPLLDHPPEIDDFYAGL